VVRQLRAAGVTTPILVLTARGTWTERVAGIDAGADDYLPKPFTLDQLKATLDRWLPRPEPGVAAPVQQIEIADEAGSGSGADNHLACTGTIEDIIIRGNKRDNLELPQR